MVNVSILVVAVGCGQATQEETTPEPAVVEQAVSEILDAVAAAPDVYTALFEDERVRVVEMTLAAGATDGHHRHPHETVYFLSGGAVRVELPAHRARLSRARPALPRDG